MADCDGAAVCRRDLPDEQKPQAVALFSRGFVTIHVVGGVVQPLDLFVGGSQAVINDGHGAFVLVLCYADMDGAALSVVVDTVLNQVAHRPL